MITMPYVHINDQLNFTIRELIKLQKECDKIRPSFQNTDKVNIETIDKLRPKIDQMHTLCKVYPALILESFIAMYRHVCAVKLSAPTSCDICNKETNPEQFPVAKKFKDYLEQTSKRQLDPNVKKLIDLVMKFRHKTVHGRSQKKNVFSSGPDYFHGCVAIALSASIHHIILYMYNSTPKYPNSNCSKLFGFASPLIENTYRKVPACQQTNKSIKKIRELIEQFPTSAAN